MLILQHDKILKQRLQESIDLKTNLLNNTVILNTVEAIVKDIVTCYKNDGKVLWAGNGGSAADSQHLSAELSGRFYYDRPPLFSEALHVNTSYTTAVANDYSYDIIYSRLTQAMGRKGDVLIGLSTSGNSVNVIKALEVANQIGMVTVAFTGVFVEGMLMRYLDTSFILPPVSPVKATVTIPS